MKKNIFTIDGKFYYGWVMLFCAFLPMFICYVIKVNCSPLFLTPITEELGITRTAYTQTNTIMTITMLLCSAVIGKIYKKYPVKFVLVGCVALTPVRWLPPACRLKRQALPVSKRSRPVVGGSNGLPVWSL